VLIEKKGGRGACGGRDAGRRERPLRHGLPAGRGRARPGLGRPPPGDRGEDGQGDPASKATCVFLKYHTPF